MTLRLSIRPGFVAILCALLLLEERLPWLLLMTVAVHELGHLLALQCLGVKEARLELSAGGGVLDCPPLNRRELIITALAGPLANLLWAALLLRPVPEAALLSVGTACFNLLPVPPLDGGVALRAGLDPWAILPAALVTAAGLLSVALFVRPLLGLWPLLLCLWLGLRSSAEYCRAKKLE